MKRNNINVDIEKCDPLVSEGAFDARKTYTRPTVVHQRVEAEHGFMAGSKTVTASPAQATELWKDETITTDFDWDAN